METFWELGLAGMFCSAFLAATLLPLGSEAVLAWLLLHQGDPPAVIGVATLGNVLGSVVNYGMGYYGSQWLTEKFSRVSARDLTRARERFKSWGIGSLLLAWVPVIGDPITVAAGVLKVNFWVFLILVTMGKLARYLVLAVAVLAL